MDTTAKVDIRKLQLLNDRIAQTIDALNQVRLSVHGLGLSHTGGNVPNVGIGVGGLGFGGVGQQGFGQQGFGGWGTQGWGAHGWGAPGLGHTTPYGYPQAYVPYLQQHLAQHPFAQQVNPLQVNPLLAHVYGQQAFGGGLSHTSPDALGINSIAGTIGVDPMTAARLMQVFPYAQMPISPIL